jgi:hypothetical protein
MLIPDASLKAWADCQRAETCDLSTMEERLVEFGPDGPAFHTFKSGGKSDHQKVERFRY